MGAALLLLFAGSLYVVAAAPRPERPRPFRDASPTVVVRTAAAMDEAAQTHARDASAAALVVFEDLGSFDEVTPALLGMIEPSLSYTSDGSASETEVSVVGHGHTFAVAVRSASGTCWWLRVDGRDGAVSHGSGDGCTASDALAADRPDW